MSDYAAHGGSYALHMDVSAPSAFHNLNEEVLTVDLSNASGASLRFWRADWDGPAGSTSFQGSFTGSFDADGIAISPDGVTWHPIWQASTQSSDVWQQYTVDISSAAQSAGIALGPSFKIKFQQYDNLPRPFDGRAWDDIVVTATVADEPEPKEDEPPREEPKGEDLPYELDLREYIASLPRHSFKRGHWIFKHLLRFKVKRIERAIYRGRYRRAERRIGRLVRRVDGCPGTATPDESPERNDWVWDCEAQRVIRSQLEAMASAIR